MKKIIFTVLLILVILIAITATYVKLGMPNLAAAPDIHVDVTAQRIARGAYLANHVSVCVDCHSARDWSKYAAPLITGSVGKGGEYFGEEMGFPGKFYAKNITPAHLKNWTDGEIYRAITTGVDANGDALFPVMPYKYYGKMDKEDILDIIAYVRSLPAINNSVANHSVDFPMSFILNTIPHEAEQGKKPLKSDTINYGGYLVSAAGCIECHTKADKGQIIPKLAFSGGRDFQFPAGRTYSANITQDRETGIGNWTADVFVSRFKMYMDTANLIPLRQDQLNTPMPWAMYAGMDTSDLRSIFAYLQTIEPIRNNVNHFVLNAK